MLVVVVIIGLLAAMAIPAFEKVRQTSQARLCINQQRQLAAALDQYRLENGSGAQEWSDVAGPGKLLAAMPACPLGGTYNGAPTDSGGYHVTCSLPGHDPAALPAR